MADEQKQMIDDILGSFNDEPKDEPKNEESTSSAEPIVEKEEGKADVEGTADVPSEAAATGTDSAKGQKSEAEPSGEEETASGEAAEDSVTEPEGEDKDALINRLRDELNKAYGKKEQPEKTEPATGKADEPSEKEQELLDFLADTDFETVKESKEEFNKFLNKFYHKMRGEIAREATKVASATASSQAYYREQVSSFYRDNPDLQPVQQYVGAVASQLAAEKPELEFPALLAETATRVRKNLGLAKQAQEKEASRIKQKPALPSTSAPGGGAGRADNRSDQQKQIDEILR